MKARALPVLIAALALGLLLAGGQAFAAPPPTIMVQVIGHGAVTGASGAINCGNGHTNCATAFGGGGGTFNLKAGSPASGWSFSHWEDTTTACGTASCDLTQGTDTMATAVFTTSNAVNVATLTANVTQDGATDEGHVGNTSGNYNIDCGTPSGGVHAGVCSLDVVTGSTITVRESPNAGYVFKNWGGACSSSEQFCSVYMDGAHNVSGDFVSAGTTPLTVIVDGPGSVVGAGVNCKNGATCTVDEPSNSKISLKATPNDGYAFTGWEGACLGTQQTCDVDMSASSTPPSVTAHFSRVVPVLLTVNGAGTVSGAGLSCGPGPATCSGSLSPGTIVQFQATPTAVGGTVTWLGCTSASGTICNVVVGSNPISITSTFTGGTTGGGGSFVQLSVAVSGDGYVTAITGQPIWCTTDGGTGCNASLQQNTSVTLRAIFPSGGSFTGWTGACSGAATNCTVTMATAKSVAASFSGDNTTDDLTVTLSGNGTVTGAGLNCKVTGSSGCRSPQADGVNVVISATPGPGYDFDSWSGDCSGDTPTCTVSMDSDQNVIATFKATAPQTSKLAITVSGRGTVHAGTASCIGLSATKATSCTETVRTGSAVQLKATPAKGYIFVGWKGACTGSKTPCAIALDGNAAVTATFRALIAAGAKKPTVAHLSTGFRITISFRAGVAGTLTVTSKPKSATVKKTVKAGAGTARLTVKKHGRYIVTLSLRSKSGAGTLRYTVKV